MLPAASISSRQIKNWLWKAVESRDDSLGGQFVYAVRTTGVYCRPSCGAKRPRRENVAFYATAEEAEQAGFRACKRCKPNQPALRQQQAALIACLCREIEQNDVVPTLNELAEKARMSPGHLQRLFRKTTGLSPRAYAVAHRADRVRKALAAHDSVTEAIYAAGFGSTSRFYEKADQWLGMSPGAYRDGGTGTRVRFALGQCSLGAILVAATSRGLCAISLGDEPDELLRELEDRFPAAELVAGDADFQQWMARVVGVIETPQIGLDLPLDIRGTAFQQRVWDALQTIPAGQTLSYAELAARIGAPGSARAVAGACAANPLAVAIPCHRVVRSDGNLSGYRWGIERKRRLLDREAGGNQPRRY